MNYPKTPQPVEPQQDPLETEVPVDPRESRSRGEGSRTAPQAASATRSWSRLAVAMVVILLVAIGIWTFANRFPGTAEVDPNVPVATVKRINLRDTVVERGTLSSQQAIGINCEMDSWQGNKIIFILPEGSKVKKGDVVIRFDSSQIEERINQYRQYVAEYRLALQNAKEDLIVQKKDNESAIRAAEQAFEFAKIDRDKYLNGDYKVNKSDIAGSISEQVAAVDKIRRQLENTEVLVEKGFAGFESLRAKEQELRSAELRLTRDRQKMDMLEKYEYPKMKMEYNSKVEEAEFKVKTEKELAKSRLAQKQQNVDGKKNELKIREDRLKEFEKGLEKAVVRAPAAGTLAYNRDHWRSDEIREGGTVYNGQTLMNLPNMRKMQVEVGIHESLVSKVKPKQPAAIRIDSYAGVPFTGRVKSVAPLAESGMRVTAKNYKTVITIDDIPEDVALKPGMTAQVELLIGYYPDVVVVPVQAVATHNDNKYVYRRGSTGDFERTPIESGRSNISFLEITSGLEPGDEVALDAFQRAAVDFGDLDDLAESTMSKAAESLDTDVLKEIEEDEQKAKDEASRSDADDPEAPPTVILPEPDPEAPPKVNPNATPIDDK